MKCQRFRWIAVVASLTSVAVIGDLKAQMGMGQPRSAMIFHEPPVMDSSGACGCEECIGLPGGGHDAHRLGRGLGTFLAWLAPYGEGGCCAPRWFDIHAEAVFLKLDSEGRSIVFSRDGLGANRITSGDLGFYEELGMRISAAYQTGPGSNLEFTYLGLMDHVRTATTERAEDDLQSAFSNFAVPVPLHWFDNASFHQVRHRSRLDSFELNYRRRWIGPTCTVQGSWLAGVRYAQIREEINFLSEATVVDPDPLTGEGRYDLDVGNHMTGFQLGGDVWVCILPGLNIGLDGKAGIYGNNANQRTTMSSDDPSTGFRPLINERVSGEEFSFLGEAAVLGTYRVNHQFAIRGGYQLLYVEGVATAMSNFNATNDTVNRPRTPFLADNSNRFYHGFTIGAEWMW